MRNFTLKSSLFVLFFIGWYTASAYNCKVNGIYYNLNTSTKEATVTYYSDDATANKDAYTGYIIIPSTITYYGKTYSVTSIAPSAFYGCSNLSGISIPNSVTFIWDYAFRDCSSLTAITIPKSVTIIGSNVFEGCSSMNTIVIESGNTKYDSRNNCNAIIETATNTLIAGCKNTIIPNSVTSIGNWAFYNCSGLTSLTIPSSVTSIGNSAFRGCSGLTSLTIPNSVTSIESSAFSGCSGLTSLTIPKSVTSIGSYAFSGCWRLKYIVSEIVEPFVFGTSAFNGIPVDCVLTVPYGTKDAYIAEGWTTSVFRGGIVDRPKCATPTVTLFANGNLKVECATEGAKCVTNITAARSEPLYGEEICLAEACTVYNVSIYATAEGYDDSDVVTTSFTWNNKKGDIDGDGQINISDVTALVNLILGK